MEIKIPRQSAPDDSYYWDYLPSSHLFQVYYSEVRQDLKVRLLSQTSATEHSMIIWQYTFVYNLKVFLMYLLYSDDFFPFFQTPEVVQFIEQADENNTIKCRHVLLLFLGCIIYFT